MIGPESDKKMQLEEDGEFKWWNLFFLAMRFKKVVYLKEECEEANNNEDGLLKEYSQEVILDLPGFLKNVQYYIPTIRL